MLTGKKLELKKRLKEALDKDPELLCEKVKAGEVLGHNPDYLKEVLGITKSDLIRLERLGLAMKARYETRHPKADLFDKLNEKRDSNLPPLICKTGTHRVRWILFKEALE